MFKQVLFKLFKLWAWLYLVPLNQPGNQLVQFFAIKKNLLSNIPLAIKSN